MTISDGTVYAYSVSGAGIGSGKTGHSGTVNISGGNVTAELSNDSAAIGDGDNASAGIVNISGGIVNATNSGDGAAIGTGRSISSSGSSSVNITGGEVNATNSGDGAAIGKGGTGSGTVAVTISGGTVTASNTNSKDAVNGTVVISPAPAGSAIAVLAGNSASDNQQLEGSPFTEVNEITSLLTGKHWFHSEMTAIQLVTNITLDPAELTLKLGETTTATLTATVAPANATNPALLWTSSDPDVVAVDTGNTRAIGQATITALKSGKATITAKAKDGSGVQALCTVTVEAAPAATEAPDSTETVAPVKTPAPTETPAPAETPAPTKAPDSTNDSGSSSTSSGSVAPTATPVPAARNETGSTGSGAAVSTIPQTADESSPAFWLVLLTVSVLGLGGVFLLKRKVKN